MSSRLSSPLRCRAAFSNACNYRIELTIKNIFRRNWHRLQTWTHLEETNFEPFISGVYLNQRKHLITFVSWCLFHLENFCNLHRPLHPMAMLSQNRNFYQLILLGLQGLSDPLEFLPFPNTLLSLTSLGHFQTRGGGFCLGLGLNRWKMPGFGCEKIQATAKLFIKN